MRIYRLFRDMFDKAFFVSVVVSLAAHSFIIAGLPSWGQAKAQRAPRRNIEISYRKIVSLPNVTEARFSSVVAQREVAPFLSRVDNPARFSKSRRMGRARPVSLSHIIRPGIPPTFSGPKKNVSLLEKTKMLSNDPAYMDYYRLIRERIRRYAYVNYSGREKGRVEVAFVILHDGQLGDYDIVVAGSVSGGYLKDVALKTIKDAVPYPPIPKRLDYPELSFDVIIVFESG
ncbi:MAG: energy transducer TonB [Candidatus Omnitrophota bacterium]